MPLIGPHIQIYWQDLENEINHLSPFTRLQIIPLILNLYLCRITSELAFARKYSQRRTKYESVLWQYWQDARAVFLQHNMSNVIIHLVPYLTIYTIST